MSYQPGVGQRTAVVTGAAAPRGIGYATARRYAQEGWAVALLDIEQTGVTTATQCLSDEFDVPSTGLAVDVTDPGTIHRSVTEIADSDLPPVGAIANIAGLASPVPFLDVDLALWHRVLRRQPHGDVPDVSGLSAADDRERVRTHCQHVICFRPARRWSLLQDALLGGEGWHHRPHEVLGP